MSRAVALGLGIAALAGAVTTTLRVPLAGAYVLLAGLALYAAWHREAAILLLMGVLGAAVGAIFGFGLGLAGIGVSFAIVLAGVALNHRHPAALAAMPAAIAPFPLMLLAVETQSIAVVFAAAFAPTLVWLALTAWHAHAHPG